MCKPGRAKFNRKTLPPVELKSKITKRANDGFIIPRKQLAIKGEQAGKGPQPSPVIEK